MIYVAMDRVVKFISKQKLCCSASDAEGKEYLGAWLSHQCA